MPTQRSTLFSTEPSTRTSGQLTRACWDVDARLTAAAAVGPLPIYQQVKLQKRSQSVWMFFELQKVKLSYFWTKICSENICFLSILFFFFFPGLPVPAREEFTEMALLCEHIPSTCAAGQANQTIMLQQNEQQDGHKPIHKWHTVKRRKLQ